MIRKFLMTATNKMNRNPSRMKIISNSNSSSKQALYSNTTLQKNEQKQNEISLKPWKEPVVECKGDYREEQFLEQYIGGPLYENQTKLLKLPVPDVQDTIERLLPTAQPLAKNEKELNDFNNAATEFAKQSESLQKRLLERKEKFDKDNSSWLQLWWNKYGYLQVRDPIPINVNYFFHFEDDPTLPTTASPNVHRSASIIYAMANYRRLVCSGQKDPEKIGKKDRQKVLCSTAYKYMFHACRIPKLIEDSVNIYDPALHKHVIVARNGSFFALDFLDKENGNVLPIEVLEKRIQKCIELADAKKNSNGPHYELGWLTGSNRDEWANARTALLQLGGTKMSSALEKLEAGAIVINLDDEDPISRKECAELFLHGNSAKNRWFDKSIEMIVTNNGKTAFFGEHSLMDGMPLVNFADHLTKHTYEMVKNESDQNGQNSNGHSDDGVTDIFQDAFKEIAKSSGSSDISKIIEKAKNDYMKLVTDHSIDVQSFHGYGSNFIKQAGYSPDAYVQMAMQLATYRLFGEQVGTYEATQVRPFVHGRTETTRTVSIESSNFIKEFGMKANYYELVKNPESRKKKLDLLQKAVNAHVKYMGLAAQGQGVDRHLLGLSLCVEENETPPTLYSDPVFVRSKRWRVSTSHLTHPKFVNWGYGEVFPDGVGLSYSIHPRHCVFSVTALKEQQWTSKLCELLEEALLEMRTLIEIEKPELIQSKL